MSKLTRGMFSNIGSRLKALRKSKVPHETLSKELSEEIDHDDLVGFIELLGLRVLSDVATNAGMHLKIGMGLEEFRFPKAYTLTIKYGFEQVGEGVIYIDPEDAEGIGYSLLNAEQGFNSKSNWRMHIEQAHPSLPLKSRNNHQEIVD